MLAVSPGILASADTLLGGGECALLKQCLVRNIMMKKQKWKHIFASLRTGKKQKESEAIPPTSTVF